ncbi:uracil-DNA glycosylase family protein [Salipiger sp. CCB-MM3]|uniref:uracil-DNA glycosylase family protein n=1 Tax=Salipiger sp. CCB-MM3 TaxID=1792508 RepID=UPI0009F32AAB
MCQNSVDFRRGDASPDLVLLGACPGQEESAARPQRPFAGQSGINLSSLLAVLNRLAEGEMYGLRPPDFRSLHIDDYTLMNAHHVPKWREQDRRSTPRMSEVESPENLLRLSAQLRTVRARVVIGLGRPVNDAHLNIRRRDSGPMRAIRRLQPDHQGVLFLITGHPSAKAVNRYGGGDRQGWFEGKMSVFPTE